MTYEVCNVSSNMETFQAKSIQEILLIPRHRYDYILMKIGIKPEYEQASGRGKINIFSFRNLLEFATATTAVDLGMAPNLIRTSLEQIHLMEVGYKANYFNREAKKIKEIYFHVASSHGMIFTCFSGDVTDGLRKPAVFVSAENFTEKGEFNTFNAPNMIKAQIQGWSTKALSRSKGYITLNLYEIKKEVMSKL